MPVNRETQVLIIGGGSAGLCAALAARKNGVDVTLVFKKGGNTTLFAAGGHSVVLDGSGNADSVESHYHDTMESGSWLNDPRLVRIMVEKGPQEFMAMVDLGVSFIRDAEDRIKCFYAGGHSYPRTIRCEGGNTHQLYRILLAQAKEKGVKILKGFQVLELLADQGKVQGAVGLDAEGNIAVIRAKAVILASGGLGQLYQNTTNPPGITGEGYILGLEAGASLIDMEFIQFMPTSLVYPPKLKGVIVTDTLRGEGAVLLNTKLERFMTRYAPEKMEVATRDVVARAIYQEIIEGRGTQNQGVYIDARDIQRESMLQSFTNAHRLIALGIDPGEKMIEVAPSAHFCCGGIVIDDTGFTGVEGLWAAGEAAGGVHGANRLGANALTENLVFGSIAGRNAAKWAASYSGKWLSPGVETKQLEHLESVCVQKDAGEGLRTMLANLESKIKEVVWQSAGIIRKEDTLEKGLGIMEELYFELEALGKNELLGSLYPLWSRLIKMSLLGRIIIGTALRRKESRGVHYRLDYPQATEDIYNIMVTADEDKTLHYSSRIPSSEFRPPK